MFSLFVSLFFAVHLFYYLTHFLFLFRCFSSITWLGHSWYHSLVSHVCIRWIAREMNSTAVDNHVYDIKQNSENKRGEGTKGKEEKKDVAAQKRDKN